MIFIKLQVRELRTTAAQKDAALRRAALSLEDFVYAMNESRFKPLEGSSSDIFKVAEQRLYGKLDKKGNKMAPFHAGSSNGANNVNGNTAGEPSMQGTANGNNGNNNSNGNTGNQAAGNQEKNRPTSPKLNKKPSPHDGLLDALNLEPSSDHKLKRLHDILKPYMIEGGVDVSLLFMCLWQVLFITLYCMNHL